MKKRKTPNVEGMASMLRNLSALQVDLSNTKKLKPVNGSFRSSVVNSGDFSNAVNNGHCSNAVNSGDFSNAVNIGDRSSALNSGDWSNAVNNGDLSNAVSNGDWSSVVNNGREGVAISLGIDGKAKAILGGWIAIVEWQEDEESHKWHRVGFKSAKVDGKTIKANTFYKLVNGEFVETE